MAGELCDQPVSGFLAGSASCLMVKTYVEVGLLRVRYIIIPRFNVLNLFKRTKLRVSKIRQKSQIYV
jgi:hypothetical protein